MRLLHWWSWSVACACVWASPAWAESVREKRAAAAQDSAQLLDARAAATFKEGIAAFDRRDFEAARVAFLQAYALKPEAVVVRRNLGLAEIYSGHYLDGARRLARVFHTTAEGNAEDRARMLESLKLAEAHLERISVEVAQQGAQIHIDDVDLGPSPMPFLWYVSPGLYRVRVDKPGFMGYAESRLARPGSAQHLRIVLQPFVEQPAAPPVPPMPAPDVLVEAQDNGPNPWLLLTGGVLTTSALAIGAVFSINSAESRDRAEQLRADLRGFTCNAPEVSGCAQLLATTRRHDRQARMALGSFIGAGVTGVATLLYGLLAGGEEQRVPSEEARGELPRWPLHAVWQRGPYAAWTGEF